MNRSTFLTNLFAKALFFQQLFTKKATIKESVTASPRYFNEHAHGAYTPPKRRKKKIFHKHIH